MVIASLPWANHLFASSGFFFPWCFFLTGLCLPSFPSLLQIAAGLHVLLVLTLQVLLLYFRPWYLPWKRERITALILDHPSPTQPQETSAICTRTICFEEPRYTLEKSVDKERPKGRWEEVVGRLEVSGQCEWLFLRYVFLSPLCH